MNNDNAGRIEREEDPSPPSENDGPQEPVDDSELEEESHPTLPEDVNDEPEGS